MLSSAIRFLDAALTAYGRGERDVFALHAGVAIEHLMKARLAAINPLLILDTDRRPKAEALLWLAEPWKNGQRPPESLRTIGGERATELISPRVVDLSSYAEALTKLRDPAERDRSFRIGRPRQCVEHLPMILAAAVGLAQGLVDDGLVVFGSHREFAVEQLEEWADAEQRELAGRFTQARQRLAERDPR